MSGNKACWTIRAANDLGLPMRRASLLLLLLLAPKIVLAADSYHIGPSFACPRPAPADGLSQLICDNADMSREELVFEQAYYALRHLYGKSGWKALKVQAVAFNTNLRKACNIPLAGAPDQTMPAGAPGCYIAETEKDRSVWLSQMTGAAHDEALRPIEQHIALQQHLVDLGYLPSGTPADGIYGETTRTAVAAWQRNARRAGTDGFLSDDDAAALLQTTATASSTPLAAALPPAAGTTDAGGGALLHTTAAVDACVNPRATRAINNTADPRQADPGWVAYVKKDGNCFDVSPDQSWERISEEGGLLLLRRVPPMAGEPPLFFRPGDIAARIQAAEPEVAAAPLAPVAPPAPSPLPPDASADAAPGAPAEVAPPAVTEAAPPAADTSASASVSESSSEPPPAPVAPTSSDSSGAAVLVVILVIVGAVVGIIIAGRRAAEREVVRRRGRALAVAVAEIVAQQRPLQVKKLQLVAVDAYGTADPAKWIKEKEYFFNTRIVPLLAAEGLQDEWSFIAGQVNHRLELAAAAPFAGDVVEDQFRSDPQVFDPRMSPTDYELHCALLLRASGWDAQTTVASGDQGTDVLARRGGRTLVVQCKLYSQPVGNSAVQEISAARLHQRADYAAVVSNATYTAAARQLARTNGVYLLHHEELRGFAPG